jgi:hypothetical protein
MYFSTSAANRRSPEAGTSRATSPYCDRRIAAFKVGVPLRVPLENRSLGRSFLPFFGRYKFRANKPIEEIIRRTSRPLRNSSLLRGLLRGGSVLGFLLTDDRIVIVTNYPLNLRA